MAVSRHANAIACRRTTCNSNTLVYLRSCPPRHALRSAHAVAHIDAASRHLADGMDEFFGGSLFSDVAVRSRLQRAVRIKRPVMDGDNEQLDLPIHRSDFFN